MSVGKVFEFPLKPEQLGLSSSIRLEGMCVQTFLYHFFFATVSMRASDLAERASEPAWRLLKSTGKPFEPTEGPSEHWSQLEEPHN